MIGYPKKKPKKKLKKEFGGDKSKYDTYKNKYQAQVEGIDRFNVDYRENEKQMRRLMSYLVSNKFIKPNIMKTYRGMWIETYQLYKKAMKVINDEKKIKI